MESQCIVFKNKWTTYDEKALSLKYLVCFFSCRSIYANCSCDNLKMNMPNLIGITDMLNNSLS